VADVKWDEATILDVDHLSGFTGGDPDFECQVLDIFKDNAPGYLAQLENMDTDGWKVTAHKFKGAARSIGAWNLACAAERAEQMVCPAKGTARRTETLALLAKRLGVLLEFIQSHQHKLRG
jgi:HPt (histidine-containing phosphotransfer) domain-containing protein